jgi:hypothetical protein
MALRTSAFGLVAFAALAMVAGCSTEAPESDGVQVDVEEAPVETTGMTGVGCLSYIPGLGSYACVCAQDTSAATHRTASRLFQFALGDDSFTFPNGTDCDATRSALLALRDGIAAQQIAVSNYGTGQVCSRQALVFELSDKKSRSKTLGPILTALKSSTEACFGRGVREFLLFNSVIGDVSTTYMDPEPATLTANLGSTTGSSASAYFTDSLAATNVRKLGSSYTSCGTILGGAPCSTVALSAGAQATSVVVKSGTLCSCR